MVYAIADLHFDSIGDKPMDIFGENWENHETKIMKNWETIINDKDIILLPGDISWALRNDEAYKDLEKIESLPGKKIIIKGNHDYWWVSLKKLKDMNFKSIDFLQNNSFVYNKIAFAGTRGWSDIDLTKELGDSDINHDEKVFSRELNRLELSLKSIKEDYEKLIVMLHYPPFDMNLEPNEFGEILEKYNVDVCLYGHLHGDGHKFVKEGNINGVEYICVASDYIDFIPKRIL